jgi:ADP-dependent NAD(P)H-hydrate dehydratase
MVDAARLRQMPVPAPDSAANKDERGRVVVIGGSRETPGGVHLAGLAALRVGAGRVHLATVASVAVAMAVAFPEARVTGLLEGDDGAIQPSAAGQLAGAVAAPGAALIGVGAIDADSTRALLEPLLSEVGATTMVVLDAAAAHAVRGLADRIRPIASRVVIMPNPEEMANLLDWPVDVVRSEPLAALDECIARLQTTVALRDATTWTGTPDGRRFVDAAGGPALGTSGSGDVLAGMLGGLLARGAEPLTATVWAVHVHGVAGTRVRGGIVGLLARELLDELPRVLHELGRGATPAD